MTGPRSCPVDDESGNPVNHAFNSFNRKLQIINSLQSSQSSIFN